MDIEPYRTFFVKYISTNYRNILYVAYCKAISDGPMAIFRQEFSNKKCSFYADLKPDHNHYIKNCKTGLRLE